MRKPEDVVRRVRERTEQYEAMQKNGTSRATGRRKGRLRMVLLATGIAVLVLGVFTATAGREYVNRFFELFGSKNESELLKDVFIPIGQSAEFGDYTVTVEDMIGDVNTMWVEISTDCEVDAPNGWLISKDVLLWFTLKFKGEILYPEDFHPAGNFGWSWSPFARDGKLWYLLTASYNSRSEEEQTIDFGKMPIRLTVTGHDWRNGGTTYSYVFNWKNDYISKRETFFVDRTVGNCTVTEVSMTITGLEILTTAENVSYITVDHITLEDGTVLYCRPNDMPVGYGQRGERVQIDKKKCYVYYYNLLNAFRASDDSEFRIVPYERISSICINGVEIKIR